MKNYIFTTKMILYEKNFDDMGEITYIMSYLIIVAKKMRVACCMFPVSVSLSVCQLVTSGAIYPTPDWFSCSCSA